MRDIIDGACTDWLPNATAQATGVTYDCSNGLISNTDVSSSAYVAGSTTGTAYT